VTAAALGSAPSLSLARAQPWLGTRVEIHLRGLPR